MQSDHNLTDAQLELASWIRDQHIQGNLPESFTVDWKLRDYSPDWGTIREIPDKREIEFSKMEALEADGFIRTISKNKVPAKKSGVNKQGVFQYGWPAHEESRKYTILGRLVRLGDETSKAAEAPQATSEMDFIDKSLVEEIRSAATEQFDTTRLVRYCEEINDNYKQANYSSVIFLSRAILDHCPPVFGHNSFASVAAQAKGRSFKKIANRLNESLKSIADHHIHRQISSKEMPPTRSEIDFCNDLNHLLGRIVEELQK
jgi:hypothetical protein